MPSWKHSTIPSFNAHQNEVSRVAGSGQALQTSAAHHSQLYACFSKQKKWRRIATLVIGHSRQVTDTNFYNLRLRELT